jgi:hypothetical protein
MSDDELLRQFEQIREAFRVPASSSDVCNEVNPYDVACLRCIVANMFAARDYLMAGSNLDAERLELARLADTLAMRLSAQLDALESRRDDSR